jgi:hypothetical protein
MDRELVQWDSYDPPVPMKRATRKEQERIQQELLRRRRRGEAAVDDAEFQIVAEARLDSAQALLRSKGSHDLLDYGAGRTTQRSHANVERSRGNPHLEQLLRAYDETGTRIDQIIAYETYGTGRR